jgi:hypothetical protein
LLLLQSFEYRGLWWLPEAPEQKIAGVLAFTQEAISLELIGALPRPEPIPDESGEIDWPAGPLARDRILGLATSGKAFTLENCQATHFNLSSPGLITERFAPGLVIEGAHYAAGEAVLFDELSLRYTQLDAWVATSGFKETFAEVDGDVTIDVSFRAPEHVVVQLPQATIEIGFAWNRGGGGAPLGTQVTLQQQAGFVLRFPKPTPLDQALDFVYQLRNFLALGVGRPVTPTKITGILLPEKAGHHPLAGVEPQKMKLNLFYRLSHVEAAKDVHPAMMLFTLPDARERLAELLGNWFSKQELLRPVFDLYFGAIYNRRAFLEQRFLSLMQAVETYHRRTSAATELSQADHDELLAAVLVAAPPEHREWLRKKLNHSNELVLRKRLDDVLKRCPKVVKKLVDKKSSFVHRVGTARNYLTHYSPDLAEEAPTGLDLYPLTVQLQALVEMCVLLELGFDCDEIDRFFERAARYREARQP